MAKHTFSISLSRNDGDENTESAIRVENMDLQECFYGVAEAIKRLCKDEDVPFSSFVLACIAVDKSIK